MFRNSHGSFKGTASGIASSGVFIASAKAVEIIRGRGLSGCSLSKGGGETNGDDHGTCGILGGRCWCGMEVDCALTTIGV